MFTSKTIVANTNLSDLRHPLIDDLTIKKLIDGSEYSQRLREILREKSTAELKSITNQLHQSKTINTQLRGLLYQDIVNTLGLKLGYNVEFGLYRGRAGTVNHDGLWISDEVNILIEVKANSTYRINIPTILGYSDKISQMYNLHPGPPVLLVLVDNKTENLEAQIRGSRQDDKISIIGIEAMFVASSMAELLGGGPALSAIRSLLHPRDFTKLDSLFFSISDVISETLIVNSPVDQFSEKDEPENAQELLICKIIKSLEKKGLTATRIGKKNIVDSNNQQYQIYFLKRFHRTDQQYWISLDHELIRKIINDQSILCLGFENKNFFVTLDFCVFEKILMFLNTFKSSKRTFVHLGIRDDGGEMTLLLPKSKDNLLLQSYISTY